MMYGFKMDFILKDAEEYFKIFKFLELNHVIKEVDLQYKEILQDLNLEETFLVLDFLLCSNVGKKSVTKYMDKVAAILHTSS